MSSDEVLQIIQASADRILSEAAKPPVVLTRESPMWGAGGAMDSLDLAVLVVELEERIGKDPFKDGFVNFRTAGELADLYAG